MRGGVSLALDMADITQGRMARIRTIKPEIARHELLFETERASGLPIRFAWAVLPTLCDREGRFRWRPRVMKPDVLPYDDVDFETVMNLLLERGFVVKYRHGSEWYGLIPTFLKHQHINPREVASTIPDVEGADEVTGHPPTTSTRARRVVDATADGRGREGKGTEDSAETPRVTTPTSPTVLTFPTTGGEPKTWALTAAAVAEWQTSYPGIDVEAECRQALAWVKANPKRAKTARGMAAFLVNWFNRAVQRGGNSRPLELAGTHAADPIAQRNKARYGGMRFGQ